jgi:two-component system, LytTR family, response regulator
MQVELRALIIDDEAMACDLLEYLIVNHVPAITSIKKATSASKGLTLIQSFNPEIIFLDIHMPFMNGFELLNSISHQHFSVIFTTAFNKYAITAIRFSALDYLLKPVDAEELTQAVNRYLKQRAEKVQVKELYRNFIDNLYLKEKKQFKLALTANSGIRLADPSEIVHCVGINNYTQFHLTDASVITVSRTIKEFEELLADHGFIRSHKSHLVNVQFIKEIKNEHVILLKDGQSIEISRRRQRDVWEALRKLQ